MKNSLASSLASSLFAFALAFTASADGQPAIVEWSSGDLAETGIPSGVAVTGHFVEIDEPSAEDASTFPTATVYEKMLAGDYGESTTVVAQPDALEGGLYAAYVTTNATLPAYVLGLFTYERKGGTYALHAVGKYEWGSATPGFPANTDYTQIAEVAVANGAEWVLVAGTPDDSEDDSEIGSAGGSATPTATAAPSYKVEFLSNGGTGKMKTQSFKSGQTKRLLKNTFKRKGYVFKGWAKSKSKAKNGKVAFKDQQKVRNLTASGGTVTLYAVWAKKPYKVKFYRTYKGVKGKMKTQSFKYGQKKKLLKNKFKRDGYVFVGWAKSKAKAKKGKVTFKNRQKVKNLTTAGKTVKLYAVWKKK